MLARRHGQDVPPEDFGRWPVTVVSIPPLSTRTTLERWMGEACELGGPGHFLTVRIDASHITIRALETYRDAAHPEQAASRAWTSAMRTAADDTARLHSA